MGAFEEISRQLRALREERGWTQAALAARLGRNQSRISEFERALADGRLGNDRLTMLAEICDAFDLVPILAPRARAGEVRAMLEGGGDTMPSSATPSAFRDVFVALDDDGDAS